jgi:hypothetical protein
MGVGIPLLLDSRKDGGYHSWYLEQILDNYKNRGAVDISYIRIVRRVIMGKDVFYAQFVVYVRPISMTDGQVAAANSAIAKHNEELVRRAVVVGKPTNRLRLKHSISSIIEHPCGNKTVEMIKAVGLSR